MFEPVERLRRIFDHSRAGGFRSAYHHDRQVESTRRRDLRVGRLPTAVLADYELNAFFAHHALFRAQSQADEQQHGDEVRRGCEPVGKRECLTDRKGSKARYIGCRAQRYTPLVTS